MTAHDWFVEHRVDFAVRTLDEADEAAFREHLPRCEECRREVARIERELAWLPMAAAPVPPPPGMTRRLVDGVLGGRQRRWTRWVAPAAAAASLLLAVGVWQAGERREAALEAELGRREREVAALMDTLMIVRRAERVLQARIEMDGRTGGMVIFADAVTHRWNVVVHGLPPAPPGERYQFWFICSDGMVRGAEIESAPAGPAVVTLEMPSGAGEVMGAALTMEPGSNTTGPPRGKELAQVML